ncbi:hypothetical protein [Streptomyces apocyni]|uniref:hypothetical protein n=1 Tax=Streptomyces apocyni TaxID=2654677 RepID=UPI001E306BA5|nr:hypothetical protein [Streptomyces apocyni]
MGTEGERNEFSGTAGGPVVQAETIGQVHITPPPSPPPPPAVTPRQVPRVIAPFVNQTSTLRSIDDCTGLAVLSGLPGIGKRAVVHSWAQRRRERFPGGDFYVDFTELRRQEGGADVSAGVSGCLRALGVLDPYLPPTLAELSALFRSRTMDQPVLVVLTNVTEPAQVRSLLPGGPGSVVVATTTNQDRLSELALHGAQLLALKPLSAEHGLRLISELCGTRRVADEPEAAAQIVACCAGLPIALRVAAARLLGSRRLTLTALAAELADEQHRLSALRTGGKELVTAVFNVAYDGLGPDAARLYRLLGLHPGRRWDTASAAALAQLTEDSAAELLDVLEGASLVGSEEDGRYTFHDLVRLHARQRAEDEDTRAERDGAVRRTVDHLLAYAAYADLAVMGDRMRAGKYVERVVDRGPGPFTGRHDALEWLDSRRAELLAAVRVAGQMELWQQAADLAEALTALYLNRRYVADWVESGELGVRAAVASGDQAVEARLRCLLSRPLLDRGDDTWARGELETAVERADDSGDLLLRASAREFYGRYWDRHDGERAVAVYAEALDLYHRHGDPRGIAVGRYFLGCAQDAAGQHTTALDTVTDAHARFMAINDRRMGARAKAAMGTALTNLGRDDEGVAELTSAVEMLHETGAVYYEAPAREQLAELAGERGAPDARREHLLRALEIYEQGGSPRADTVRAMLSTEQD